MDIDSVVKKLNRHLLDGTLVFKRYAETDEEFGIICNAFIAAEKFRTGYPTALLLGPL